MRLLTRVLRFARSAILQLDRATLDCRDKVYRAELRVAIAKRWDAPGRSRIFAKKRSTPIHSKQPATVPIAIPP
jgi:hypothetical protein